MGGGLVPGVLTRARGAQGAWLWGGGGGGRRFRRSSAFSSFGPPRPQQEQACCEGGAKGQAVPSLHGNAPSRSCAGGARRRASMRGADARTRKGTAGS